MTHRHLRLVEKLDVGAFFVRTMSEVTAVLSGWDAIYRLGVCQHGCAPTVSLVVETVKNGQRNSIL